MSIKAYRGGETIPCYSDDPYGETLNTYNQRLNFEFKMVVPGGGVTDVQLRIEPESFAKLAKHMMTADEPAAIRAFGEALLAKKCQPSN